MKKTITICTLSLFAFLGGKAQINLADFEDLVLPADSFYFDTTGTDFISANTHFQYDWDTTYNYWSGGFVYTNKTDSITSGVANMYSSKAAGGYNGSTNYLVAQSYSTIGLNPGMTNLVGGFYITNSTFAFNSMRDGDMFAKKFGGPTGNDPDWFKLVVRGYLNGNMKPDSVEFYLADFRFSDNTQDYIVKTWQYVDLSALNLADSLFLTLSSSDNSFGFMNTPNSFCIDNFSSESVVVGIKETKENTLSLLPNPAKTTISIQLKKAVHAGAAYSITDITGKVLMTEKLDAGIENAQLNVEQLNAGIYFLRIMDENNTIIKKFVKE
jgi:hypothetical protein